MTLRAPFPWFGGKSRAAPLVWQAFGDVANYVEPFAGSLAVLLARPTAPRVETVNDKDCYLANFWRAVKETPDEVAHWADAPVNEADLHATHRWLINGEDESARLRKASNVALQALASGDVAAAQAALRAGHLVGRPTGAAFRERLRRDESYFDAEVAGRWVWGISQWIGSGWCAQPAWEEQEAAGAVKGVGIHTAAYAKRPALDKPGRGVHQLAARGESLANAVNWEGRTNAGRAPRGVHAGRRRNIGLATDWAKRPSIGDGGARGVHTASSSTWQQMPAISGSRGATGRGVSASGSRGTILEWMQALAARLRYVRVCCGDWKRVLTPSVTEAIGTTAVFLDPPYSAAAGRDPSIYAEEDLDVAHAVREWALANGDNPKLRIALCGYEGEHAMPASWRCVAWKAPGGYAASAGNKANAQRERIWLSPHCQPARQWDLFSFAGATP